MANHIKLEKMIWKDCSAIAMILELIYIIKINISCLKLVQTIKSK